MISRLLAKAAAGLCPTPSILARLLPVGTLLGTVARLLSVGTGLSLLIAIRPALIVPTLLSVTPLLPALPIRALLPTVAPTQGGHRLKLAAQPLHLA
jgi:hypothetical protein